MGRKDRSMIIMVGGPPTSGKSTLTRSIISELGSAEDVEPMKLFPCEKHGDILVVGRYPEGETFGGTDRLSYGTISKFRDFIDQEAPKHKHILIEGDRFFRSTDIEWLLDNHEARVYILTVSLEEEKRRHIERQDTQNEKWLQGRRSQISNIQTNFMLMGRLNIHQNETLEDSESIRLDINSFLTK